MEKLNKKIIILVTIASIVFLTIGVSLYAYFNSQTDAPTITASTDITTENVIEIASFDDLFNYSKASVYNDSSKTSNSSDRKILKLTQNIDLTTDIIITADVHLFLNDKTLNLNDHQLLFKHGYAGCFNMYKGIISCGTNGNGRITIDLPYASFITNNVTYYKVGVDNASQTDCVNILNIDPKYTAYSALYLIGNNIASDLNKRVEFESFDAVSDASFDITAQSKYIISRTCSYNSGNEDVCSFVYKDLDLPNHYLSTDVNITYTSNNIAVVSNHGKVTLPAASANVNLTATISHESWDDSYSCTFKLHVVNLSNTTVKNNVATQLLKAYISDYYHNTDLIVNEDIVLNDYYYEFNHGVKLPLTGLDGSITYSYSTTDLSGNSVTTTSHIEGDTYILEPNSDCFHLVINYNNSVTESINMYSAYVGDYETIARLILNKLYGGAIIYDSASQYKELYRFTELAGILDESTRQYLTAYNITGMTYSLKTGSDALTYYQYSNYILSLVDGQVPPTKSSYLTVTFTFGSGATAQTIDIDLYIDYLAESGDTLSGFLPYYNLYDPQVVTYMTQSFEMPFCFGTGAPYTCYDFATVFSKTTETIEGESITYYTYTLGMPSSLKIILHYNNADHALTGYTQGTSFTTVLDSYLSTNNITLSEIAQYGDAKYIFTIDAQNATVNSVNMLMLYNYKFNTGSNWTLYKYHLGDEDYITELTSTTFTIDGGLFWNSSSTATNAVQDKNFFAWIYNNFNPSESFTTISSSDVDSDSFIPKSWLSLDVALDVTEDSTLASVTNYAGIGNLTSITKVNLSGVQLLASVVTSISAMESVTSLNLSGCQISDISAICTMNSIKILDVSNNNINDFNGLVKLKNLEEVYVYKNNATTNNPIKGSLGITNLQTYNDLLKNGVSVFNQVSGGVPVIYADSDDYNDYVKLKSIIYQNKLSTKVSITVLYDSFDDVYTDANLALVNTGGSFTWGYQGDENDSDNAYMVAKITVGNSVTANTYYELSNGTYTLTEDTTFVAGKDYYVAVTANNATYFYVNYKFSGNTVNVKFYVDRY